MAASGLSYARVKALSEFAEQEKRQVKDVGASYCIAAVSVDFMADYPLVRKAQKEKPNPLLRGWQGEIDGYRIEL